MSNPFEKIFRSHQRYKEITRLGKGSGPLRRTAAGVAAKFTGVRIILTYKLIPPGRP